MSDQNNTNSNEPHPSHNPAKKHSKGRSVFITLIAICLLATIFSFSGILKHKNFILKNSISAEGISELKKLTNGKINFNFSKDDYIAVLHIEGVIENKNKTYNQEWLLDTIDSLKNDEDNIGIMLYIDSPGGGVYQADEIYTTLEDYKTSGKKVYAYMGPLAASGGYYIACAATKIIANRNTLTGSIGVISGQVLDATVLLEKLGLKSTTITAGKNKNMGNYNQPFTDEQKAIMQSIADEAYEQFTRIVANSRKMPIEKVQELADGRIYTARQALDNGLIDSITTFNKAINLFEDEEFDGKEMEIEHFQNEEKNSFYDLLTGAKTLLKGALVFSRTGSIEQALTESIPLMPYPAYYYPR